MTTPTREGWLLDAAEQLAARVESVTGLACPEHLSVSCGWPRNDRKGKVVGQCWPSNVGHGTSHLFISPLLTSTISVLGTLLHELVHAADDCQSGHQGAFTRAIRQLGLGGKPTSTNVPEGSELEAYLLELADELGPYPHRGMAPSTPMVKPQKNRQLKAECLECGYTLRTTQKWLDVAVPVCPDPACADRGREMYVESAAAITVSVYYGR